MSFLNTMRKRGAAALGIATVASGAAFSVAEHEDLAARGEAFVSEIHAASVSAWRGENPATHVVETSSGPVTFFLNQSGENGRAWAEEMNERGSHPVDADRINSFSRQDQASFAHALEQIRSTEAGRDVLADIAGTSNGEVRVLAMPDLNGTAVARTRFVKGEDGEFHTRDAMDEAVHIGYDPKAMDADGVSTLAYVGADGELHRATLDRIIVHELQHAAVRDDSAIHHDHGHGQTYAYNVDGKVTDLAMNAGNRHQREMMGGDPDRPFGTDRVYYEKVGLALGEKSLEGQASLAHAIADGEGAGWGMLPGYKEGQLFPPSAATMGALKLSDEQYLEHIREFAKDIAIEAGMQGGGIADLDWVKKIQQEDNPEKIISSTQPFVDRAIAAETANGGDLSAKTQDMRHHVEIAGMLAEYRSEVGARAAHKDQLGLEGLDEAIRTDPQEALGIYGDALRGGDKGKPSDAVLNDVLSEDGTHARLSGFMTKFDEARRERASERAAPYTEGMDIFEMWDKDADFSNPLYETGQRSTMIKDAEAWKERIAIASRDDKQGGPKEVSDQKPQKRIAITFDKTLATAPRTEGATPRVDLQDRVRAKAEHMAEKKPVASKSKRPRSAGDEAR